MSERHYEITLTHPDGRILWRNPSRETQLARLTSLLILDPKITVDGDPFVARFNDASAPPTITLSTQTSWVDGHVSDEKEWYQGKRGERLAATRSKAPLKLIRWDGRDERQRLVLEWARKAFGDAEATSLPQRGLRLLEESIEAFQACDGNETIAHDLVRYVFARPMGTVGQELGGVAVTALALAAAAGLSADEEECREINRVLDKPIEHFTQRNADKNAAGFRVVNAPAKESAEERHIGRHSDAEHPCDDCYSTDSKHPYGCRGVISWPGIGR